MNETEILNIFIICIFLTLKGQEIIAQEEFLNDQGRYIFDAPPSIRNRQKQFNRPNLMMNTNSIGNRQELLTTGQLMRPQNQIMPIQNPANQIIQSQIQQFQPVPTTVGPITTRPQNSQLGINLRNCIRSCPTTSEFNPVCGTDGLSYSNAQKLFCSQRCGQVVRLVRHGRCRAFQPIIQ